jgi:hypothetical protein
VDELDRKSSGSIRVEDANGLNLLFWTMVSVQILGFLSASLARASVGQAHQTFCQHLFFASFIGVAIATMSCLAMGSLWWVFSAGMFGWMAIAATWDAGHKTPETAR